MDKYMLKKQINCFNRIIEVILIQIILVVSSERWYSATEGENEYFGGHKVGYKTSYIQNGENRYTPFNFITVSFRNRTDRDEEDGISKRNRPFQKNSATEKVPIIDTDILSTPTKYEPLITPIFDQNFLVANTTSPSIIYNRTINNINIVRRIRPKRKAIRRCPTKARQRKQLNSVRAKFLEIFEVVKFDHVACVSSSGLDGTCQHEYNCRTSGGSPMGVCADGYGVCCINQYSCDDNLNTLVGWFTNPGFPNPSSERLSCVLIVEKASEDVQQIRLDFTNFELLPPTAGSCEQDQFSISGQNVNNILAILCGINTGQHVYIEVGDVDGPVYLSVQSVSEESRLFSIKVTQLASADSLAAPTGCLQYFTEPQGYLQSFNYRDKSEISIPRTPSYLNNLNYAMCIKRALGTCSVTYTNAGYLQIVNCDSDGLPVIPPGQAGVEILNCPTDWLLISATRLCGERLNDGSVLQDFSLDAPVTDISAGPIVVWFRTDGGYAGHGFKLRYQQNACLQNLQ